MLSVISKICLRIPENLQMITCNVVFKGTGEAVSVFVHDVKSSSDEKVFTLIT